MNTELKITKGLWRNPEGTTFITCGLKQMIDYAGYKTTEDEDDANAQLIIDAGNTAQFCGLLPSELLKQRDLMKTEHKIDIPLLDKWISELEQKGWHQEIVQEMKDALHAKNKLIESTNP